MPKQIHQENKLSPFQKKETPASVPQPTQDAPRGEATYHPSLLQRLWSAAAPIAQQGVKNYLHAHPGAVQSLKGWGAKIDGFLHQASGFLDGLGADVGTEPGKKPESSEEEKQKRETVKEAQKIKEDSANKAPEETLAPPKTNAVAASEDTKPGQTEPKASQPQTEANKENKSAPGTDPWRSVLKGQTHLKAGDSGAAVAKMQAELNQAGFAAPTNGVFDEATKKAILKFQNTYHIQTTGEMGPQTGNGLEEVVAWKGVASGKHILKPEEQGPAVTMLQRQLTLAGYKVELTGVYDDATLAVVKELQKSKGWGPDGKVGPLTYGAIKELQGEDGEEDTDSVRQPDNKNHEPADKTGKSVYQKSKARLKNMKVQLSKSQQGDMNLFLKNWDKNHARYEKVAEAANVPPELIAALHWRESSGNFNTYLHQGDPLGKKPTHWPTNIPTFHKWEEAAKHALGQHKSIQKMFDVDHDTTDMAALAGYSEYYNGLGYHYKDKPSPYVFSGTNQYDRGKYVADGKYDSSVRDSQLGTMAMIQAIHDRDRKQDGKDQSRNVERKSNIALTMAAHPWLEDKRQEPKPDKPEPPVSPKDPGPVAEPLGEAAKYEYYRRAILNNGGDFDARADQRNIVGVRGWMNGEEVPNVKDAYNDTLAVLWKDKLGKSHFEKYNATVDPGSFAKYYNPRGDANLVDGQYDYVLGEHKGHTALNQGEAVQVWRDGNKDGIRQKSEGTDDGWFGINIHAGGTGPRVGNYSAGCQVIRGGWDGDPWQNFIHQMKADPDHRYKYTLIDADGMPHQHAVDTSKPQNPKK